MSAKQSKLSQTLHLCYFISGSITPISLFAKTKVKKAASLLKARNLQVLKL